MNTKICTKCKKEKPLTEFHKNKNAFLGVGSSCKVCRKQYTKEYVIKKYREANKDEIKRTRIKYENSRKNIKKKIRINFGNIKRNTIKIILINVEKLLANTNHLKKAKCEIYIKIVKIYS